jgi:hypothetical protein
VLLALRSRLASFALVLVRMVCTNFIGSAEFVRPTRAPFSSHYNEVLKMSRMQKNDIPSEVLAASPTRDQTIFMRMGSSPRPGVSPPLEPTVLRAIHFVQSREYEKALEILDAEPSTPQVRNARGVCLLRLGRYEVALQLFRGLVMDADGTRVRSDMPTVYLINLATSLLLSGHPSSCLTLLGEIDNDSHPTIIELRKALHQWQSSLSFNERLNWWFGRLDPPHCRIPLNFLPGDFDRLETAPQPVLAPEVAVGYFPPALGMG